MQYREMHAGMYIVRTAELRWAKQLSGVICYVASEPTAQGLHIRATRDCVPVGNTFCLSFDADDGNWYDVSNLVLTANAAICPSKHINSFSSPIESNYRNFLGLGSTVKPYTAQSAVGNICLVGEEQRGDVLFSRVGYYIIDADDSGYMIAYRGYTQYMENEGDRSLHLQILNLSGTQRKLYPAAEVVSACHSAYTADMSLADGYTKQLRENMIVSSGDSSMKFHSGHVTSLNLEGAVC